MVVKGGRVKRFQLFFCLCLLAVTYNPLGAISPCAQLSSLVQKKVPAISGEDMLVATLELWSVFDVLKAIRLTEHEGSLMARELVAPVAGLATLAGSSTQVLGDIMRTQLCCVMRETIEAFEAAFEPAPNPDAFVIEALLAHIEATLLLESPTILNDT